MTQDEFIQQLMKTRKNIIAADPSILNTKLDTTREKSRFIDMLKAMPSDDMAPPVAQAFKKNINMRAGICSTCNNPVEAGAGHYYMRGASYYEHHKLGECPPAVAPKPPITEGFYRLTEGQEDIYIKVKMNRSTKRLNAQVLTTYGAYEYGVGLMKKLQVGNAVAVDEDEMVRVICLRKYSALPGTEELRKIALKYAQEQANCIFCGLDLTDPRSNPLQGGAGYGPVCAKRYNLPWGDNLVTTTSQTSPSPITQGE